MIESLVDYVLERGNKDYGEFAPKKQIDQNSALFNHRKMLQYLFSDQKQKQELPVQYKRISDMKAQQISGQLNYFSQRIHAELSRKYLNLDSDLHRLQNQWLRKKIPNFYCYYFLKFSYANSYSRLHELVLSEIQNMAKDKDSYWVVRKTIQARETCSSSLRKELAQLTVLDVQEALQTIKQENELKLKAERQQARDLRGFKPVRNKAEQQPGKSWKNKLQLVFQGVQHLRKLTCYLVQLISNWRTAIYNISEDPRRYRQRVIFYHHQANYLLKMLWDSSFVKDSALAQHFQFASHFDPFILKPVMTLEAKARRTQEEDILLSLIRPAEQDMDKIVKSLILLAEEEYDQHQQSRFINEKNGQLQHRKRFIEKKREGLGNRQQSYSEKKLSAKPVPSPNQGKDKRTTHFTNDKRSDSLQGQMQSIRVQKAQLENTLKSPIHKNLNRAQKLRVDLKKMSPYLSRNQLLKKAQQVIQFEQKFKLAQNEYADNLKKGSRSNSKIDSKSKLKMNEIIDSNRQTMNNRIFNKYIEQNVRMLDEANKKAFLYKNRITPHMKNTPFSVGYNKLSFHDRKEAEYQRNIQRYLPKQSLSQQKFYQQKGTGPSPNKGGGVGLAPGDMNRRGTKSIIQISSRGIKAGEKVIEFQLSGRKNLGQILQGNPPKTIQGGFPADNGPKVQIQSQSEQPNLFTSQSPQQIIILRQQPQKLQQLKRSLYEQIKRQLMQELNSSQIKKQQDLNSMVEEERRKKLQQIIEERRKQEQRRIEEVERMRIAQLQNQRRKTDMPIKIENIQYAEENLDQWFQAKLFSLSPEIFPSLFTTQSLSSLQSKVQSSLHCVFLRGFLQGHQVSFSALTFAHEQQASRKFTINYLSTKQVYSYISNFHQLCEYMWRHDPVQEIQITMFQNQENTQAKKVIQDVKEYAMRNGQVYQKQLYSNIKQVKILIYRPKSYKPSEMSLPYLDRHFSKQLKLKAQLLSSATSLSERHQPEIDMNLETYTNYIFLLEELFRSYLTPQEIVELRENSTNIRRLKDIFRVVLEMQKGKPLVDQLTVVQGLNLDDLYAKMKDKLKPPYEKYYWNNFYDKAQQNRVLLSILQTKLQLPYSINTGMINDKKMFRVNIKNKILVLKSSVYSKEDIYIVSTDSPKIRLFFMQGQNYKLMRIQLFIFLNLIFNNVVEDSQKYINAMWLPQFCITSNRQASDKKVKRITDFSISMKKSFFLSEEIHFCNHEFIRNGISPVPRNSDIIFKESMIFGMLHTDVEKSSTGMPIYAKLIDRNEFF